jgi:iron complex transport system permease protein
MWRSRSIEVAALLVLVSVLLGATAIGETAIAPLDAVRIVGARLGLLETGTSPRAYEAILLDIRLPRIVLAGVVGGALAVAGAAFQGVFRNPLAEPTLVGPAAGAALGAVLAFVLPLPASWLGVGLVQLLAFGGGLAAAAVVWPLARVGAVTPVTGLLLAGVAVSTLASAVTTVLMYLHGDQLLAIYGWLLGGFNVASWNQVRLVAPLVALAGVSLLLAARPLDLLQLGEEEAATLGLDVERAKLGLMIAATLATAAAVSAAGPIAFVGLIVPHAVRIVAGPGHRRLVPLSGLLGAAFLVAADALARSLPGPSEVPVGVVTAAVGAPFFLLLLRRQKRGTAG